MSPHRPARKRHPVAVPDIATPTSAALIHARYLLSGRERAILAGRASRGELVAVARGVYVDAAAWSTMDRHARYRTRILATAGGFEHDTVFSHDSAAALWKLPWVGPWPRKVHITVGAATGGRSNTSVFRHTTGVPNLSELIDGLRVTTLARTVADVARTSSFGNAVTVADAALRRSAFAVPDVPTAPLVRDDLLTELIGIPLHQGVVKARRAIEFADGRADRPGESMSRASIHRAGLTAPCLQVPRRGLSGRVWTVDFWWPDFNVIGEFDGKWKYTDPAFMNGRTSEQVMLDEKAREDDLRAAGYGFTRWGWAVAISPAAIRTQLMAAGVR